MIDIIIPAYNAHATIKNTLISIAMQTIVSKINVYIINDASIDDYKKEIDLFKDRINIKEIRLDKNSGPGVARQVGIDNSNSEYIIFLDSDDLLYNIFSLEKLYDNMVGSSLELSVGVIIDEREDGYYYYENHTGCLHGKLYKRSFIEKHKLRFNDTRSSEDNSFNQLYLLAAPKVRYVKDIVYLYKFNSNSISNNSIHLDNLRLYIYNMNWVVETAISKKFDDHLIARYIFSSVVYIYAVYVSNINKKDSNVILDLMKDFVKFYNKYNKLLSSNEKLTLYSGYPLDFIPNISLIEFINLCNARK